MKKKIKIALAFVAFCGVALVTNATENVGDSGGPGDGIHCPSGTKYTCWNLWTDYGQFSRPKGDGETTVEL